MAGKRAAGGGRKPKGEFPGKSSAFSTRITPELRAALDSESEKTGKSVSQIVERRLRESFEEQKRMQRNLGKDHVKALAYLVAHMTTRIESYTKARWHQDMFTNRAVASAIATTVGRCRPEGDTDDISAALPAVDEHIAQAAEMFKQTTPDMAERMSYLRNPEALGMSMAVPFLDYPDEPPPLGDKRDWQDEMYLMPFVWKALREEDASKIGEWLGEDRDGGLVFGNFPPEDLSDEEKRKWLAIQRRGLKRAVHKSTSKKDS
ncbi:hypothetical protein NKI48_29715 [Mesorhizobium sp. M0644]|uniref:hypothetical protein n=1 Tax=unclassified Mesorhizobium TaxID=325217 RepID=UPI0033357742